MDTPNMNMDSQMNMPQQRDSLLNKLAIPGAIVIAGALIAGALYFSGIKKNTSTGQDASVSAGRPITKDDHLLGNPDAKIIIVEYSDTECPYCKQFHTTMHKILETFDGKVAWVYRHFPIDQLHPKARKEAEATECAWEQGGNQKFWEYTNEVYNRTTSNNTLDPAQLPKIAQNVGLDVTAFNTCLSSGKYASKIEADYQDAIKSGGRGTPHSIIIEKDGTKTQVLGAQPFEVLKATLEAMLAK